MRVRQTAPWCQPAHNRQSVIMTKLTGRIRLNIPFLLGPFRYNELRGAIPGYESARRLHVDKTRGTAQQMFGARKEKVLTVTVTDNPKEERWILQGRLGWPWVNQLRGDWRNARRKTEPRACIVDLNGVTFVDKIGERMLRIMAIQGAQFVTYDARMRRVLENLTNMDHRVGQPILREPLRHPDECAMAFPSTAAVGR
jgi:hypothetical protein